VVGLPAPLGATGEHVAGVGLRGTQNGPRAERLLRTSGRDLDAPAPSNRPDQAQPEAQQYGLDCSLGARAIAAAHPSSATRASAPRQSACGGSARSGRRSSWHRSRVRVADPELSVARGLRASSTPLRPQHGRPCRSAIPLTAASGQTGRSSHSRQLAVAMADAPGPLSRLDTERHVTQISDAR